MLQYRIPGAELLSGAVIVVCFVIALVVIFMQPEGRSRSFGASGLALLVASTIVTALNGSLGGYYGTSSGVYAVGSVAAGVLAAAGVVLLALGVIWARKARRPRGGRR
jgi:hypothetical protein